MLISGHGTPPVEALAPLGLSSWALPGCGSRPVRGPLRRGGLPGGAVVVTRAVLVASALLAVELLVQIPFLGVNGLQAAMALVGGTAAAVAWRTRATW